MENLINLISTLTQNKNTSPTTTSIPKEIINQYPYGEFPIRYTKVGQEDIRKNSENRYANIPKQKENQDTNNLDFKDIIPILQLLSNKENSPNNMIKIFTQLFFKDKPELENLLKLFSKNTSNIKNQEIDNRENFPNTNKVNISALQKIK